MQRKVEQRDRDTGQQDSGASRGLPAGRTRVRSSQPPEAPHSQETAKRPMWQMTPWAPHAALPLVSRGTAHPTCEPAHLLFLCLGRAGWPEVPPSLLPTYILHILSVLSQGDPP